MSDDPETKLTEMEKLLVMAAALCGSPPEVVRRETHARANAGRVLRQALFWGGLWNEKTKSALYKDEMDSVIQEWYGTLIAMCQPAECGEPLLSGAGNLGARGHPPSAPAYTGFGLTEAGWQCAERLLLERPHLREAQPPVDNIDLHKFYVELDELPKLTCFSRDPMSESEFEAFVLKHGLDRKYTSADHGRLPTSWPRCSKPWWNPPESLDDARFAEYESGFAIAKYSNGHVYNVSVVGSMSEAPNS